MCNKFIFVCNKYVKVSVNNIKGDVEKRLWHILTEGSKSEQGVGSVVAVFTGRLLTEQLEFKLYSYGSSSLLCLYKL